MDEQFPQYTVTNDVAIIGFKARNGYTHRITVPTDGSGDFRTDALAFLRRCWPFSVAGTQHKKLIRNNTHLAELWANFVYANSKTHGIVRCRNHNWFDWTNGNIYLWVPTEEESAHIQETAERRAAHVRLTSPAREIALVRKYGHQSVPIHSGCDPEVADIIREAQRIPARRKYAPPDEE